MRRRMPTLFIALTAIAVAGCGDKESLVPTDRVLSAGTYGYTGSYLHPERQEWDVLDGSLVLDVATPDSIHGRWVMTGYVPDSTGGYWNENAFVFEAISNDAIVTMTHRIWRIEGPTDLRCTLTYRETRQDLDPLTTSGTCQLEPR